MAHKTQAYRLIGNEILCEKDKDGRFQASYYSADDDLRLGTLALFNVDMCMA